MATIAKGMITLVNVNDAYSVSATPNVCAIKADFDGTNPVLDEAYTDITVVRGDTKVPFTINSVTPSNSNITYEISGTDATKRLTITAIPSDALSGTLTAEVETEDEFVATVIFQYSVMREATMLDWIKDWENNKTTIGSTYLITPKIFVGKKVETEEDLSVLTGVYIGPDSENGAGIYGYKEGIEIFHINETGGSIGGWGINNGGIQTPDGLLKILSEGTIISSNEDGNCIWGLYKSGEAVFANGNVKFYTDGSAEFAGTIKSSDGVIGGWYIGEGVLRSDMMCLDSNNNYIGVTAQGASKEDGWDSNFHKKWVAKYGGVAMFYDNASYYGLVGYLPSHKIFSLGSQNLIAGWNFDDTAIWIGNKMNVTQQYTSESGSITLGTNGLRGYKWFIDSNGDVSFMEGKIKFTASDDGGEIVGWKLNANRLSTNQVALISDGSVTGLYMSANANANFNSLASTALEDYIDENGGIRMNINDTGAEFAAYDLNGKKLFKIKSDDVCSIAGWNFDKTLLYTGTPIADVTAFTSDSDSISLSPVGIFGYKWRLSVNGDGAIAGGNISWDENGNVAFANSVKIGWDNLGSTIINSEGVFAGKISADNITAGTISTANIKNATGTWELLQDGAGKLANGNIAWDANGNTHVRGLFSQELVYLYESDAIVGNTDSRFEVTLNKDLYIVTQISKDDYQYEDWIIPSDDYFTIVLPDDPYYIGKEVKIYDMNFGPYTRTAFSFRETLIKPASLSIVGIAPIFTDSVYSADGWEGVSVMGGYIQFVGLPSYKWDDNNNRIYCTQWLCVGYNGQIVVGIKSDQEYVLSHAFSDTLTVED